VDFVAGPGGVATPGQLQAQRSAQQTQQAAQQAAQQAQQQRANALLNRTPADAPLNTLVNRRIEAGQIPAADADRIRYLVTAQPVTINKKLEADNLYAWLRDRGVNLTTDLQRRVIEDLIGTPPNDRQAFIADVIEAMESSKIHSDTTLA
jgi:DNA phosphorothioation-dependent restriction protein DptG